jgi:hypothetical protein
MTDASYLDRKYFIDQLVYNCPFCNRNHVRYRISSTSNFHWNNEKKCYIILVKCQSCEMISMHLSYEDITRYEHITGYPSSITVFNSEITDIDSEIFYSVPTSFFVLDNRIPRVIRELITEAEGCIKMNFLTGASACMRKAIYELLIIENVSEGHYEDKIKSLKSKNPTSDPELYDIMAHIQEMTSDKIHEQSWDRWDASYLKLIIETLKTILHDIYVLPKIKEERANTIKKLREDVSKKNNKG